MQNEHATQIDCNLISFFVVSVSIFRLHHCTHMAESIRFDDMAICCQVKLEKSQERSSTIIYIILNIFQLRKWIIMVYIFTTKEIVPESNIDRHNICLI